MPKPSDFYIGAVTFLSVIIPGALAAYLLLHLSFISDFLATDTLLDNSAGGASAFLVSAYVLGHVMFTIAAQLDWSYDFFLKRQERKTYRSLLNSAKAVRERYLTTQTERKSINVYKWSLAVLAAKHPHLHGDAASLMAESKLFRSLTVAALSSLVFIIVGDKSGNWVPIIAVFAAGLISYYRYFELRLKAVEQAYIYVVTLDKANCLLPEDVPATPPNV